MTVCCLPTSVVFFPTRKKEIYARITLALPSYFLFFFLSLQEKNIEKKRKKM
jgi:hypothetical protein